MLRLLTLTGAALSYNLAADSPGARIGVASASMAVLSVFAISIRPLVVSSVSRFHRATGR